MKIYNFDSRFPYCAIVAAKDEEQACKVYSEAVCELEDENIEAMPIEITRDEALSEIGESEAKYLDKVLLAGKPWLVGVDESIV